MSQPDFQKTNHLSIYSGNCLRRISPLAQCNICEQLCPEHALSFENDQWKAVNCSLCGLCASLCPTQVFQIDQHRVIQYQKNQPVSLCCSQNQAAPPEAIRLNCLQQFSPLSLIYLLYHHPKLIIYLSPAQCQACRHNWYAQGLVQQLEQYQLPAEKLEIVTIDPDSQPQSNGNQRRELFRDFFHRTGEHSKKAVADTVEKLTATFTSNEVATDSTEIFPSRLPLYALYVKKQLPVKEQAELPFRQMECSACNFCSACSHVCPTQALTLTETETRKQLNFQPELCINCNLCQSVCMQKGLWWSEFLTQQDFLHTPRLLAQSTEKICSQCEHEFYQWPEPEDSICWLCRR